MEPILRFSLIITWVFGLGCFGAGSVEGSQVDRIHVTPTRMFGQSVHPLAAGVTLDSVDLLVPSGGYWVSACASPSGCRVPQGSMRVTASLHVSGVGTSQPHGNLVMTNNGSVVYTGSMKLGVTWDGGWYVYSDVSAPSTRNISTDKLSANVSVMVGSANVTQAKSFVEIPAVLAACYGCAVRIAVDDSRMQRQVGST